MIDKITVLKYSAMADDGVYKPEMATIKPPSRRGSLDSECSESAYSSNDNTTIPNHHERAASVRSYRLRRRLKKRKQIQRLVDKEGDCKVVHTHVKFRGFRFIADAFTTMVDLRWRYNLSIFTLAYVLSWFLFGIVWYGIAFLHGDIGLSEKIRRNITSNQFEPCVYNMETFTGAFLFSVETQTTIGYGFRSVTEACPHAVLLVVIQSVISCLIDAIMIGCLFAKIARPKKRAATLKFSEKAVIAMRDGKLCLMFRVGDIRNSHLFEAHVRAYAIKPRVTSEGEFIPLYHHNMDLMYETGEDRIFLVWPLIICHIIDEKSPLYNLSAATLVDADFEVVLILEGVVEQTGLTTQARTSYLPSEIQWGYRFASSVIALYSEHDKQYNIDYSKFDSMYPVPETPKQSACEIYEAMRIKEQKKKDSRKP
ncbi:ATP-sensitive inward rectifier potassium channel 12-like [Amphiura filiformis]|uniref:ATP-sensitive inward rectifier potassium channel 12-like n=1 Tax=Amphiura filiformis TaxID=82378 RepID=UPI003B213F3D